MLQLEDERRRALEGKAVLATSLAFAVAAYSLNTPGPIMSSSWWVLSVGAVATVATFAALLFAFLTLRVALSKTVEATQFTDEQIMTLPIVQRHVQATDHFRQTLEELRSELDKKGKRAMRVQMCAFVAAVFFLAFLILRRLQA